MWSIIARADLREGVDFFLHINIGGRGSVDDGTVAMRASFHMNMEFA
jgi:hypothetical protein